MINHSSRLLPGIPPVESMLFPSFLAEVELSPQEREIAIQLNKFGYAILDFPDADLDQKIERIQADLIPRFGMLSASDAQGCSNDARIQDAWTFSADVRSIAANAIILSLLEKLYGRRAFPFQTLNFPVGTQQHMHSDSVHFSSFPERYMCGVWLALEDITDEAGPLLYYPGSHKWPLLSNAMLGRRGYDNANGSAQSPYEAIWRAMVEQGELKPQTFLAKKGQCVIWAANLLHGGSARLNPALTRWSQVTHYYFEDCIYYTPAFSDESIGKLDLRCITNVENGAVEPNKYLGEEVPSTRAGSGRQSWFRSLLHSSRLALSTGLPQDFDEERYYYLNKDVAEANVDARYHYLKFGMKEGRRYK